MMNSKLTICSWIVFFMILSSDSRAVRETYSGPLINADNPSHPMRICEKALDTDLVGWVHGSTDVCATNITCSPLENNELVELPQIPETGVVCVDSYRLGTKNSVRIVHACFNGKCVDVAD